VYLETHASLDLLVQNLCDHTIEVLQHLDRDLRLDTALADEVVQCICHRSTNTTGCQQRFTTIEPSDVPAAAV